MPANKKFLTNTPLDKGIKLITGFVGGYFITLYFFSLLGHFFDVKSVLITLQFAGFILWAVLIILAFLAHKSWKILLIYLIIIALLFSLNYWIQ